MKRFLLCFLLAATLGFCVRADEPRKPHPFAPSLPELTEEEEKKLDAIIDRFILFDTGRLRGQEGQDAARAFAKLGSDAIPALLRGINRAAALNHSCPVTMIAAKLDRLLGSSSDVKLLGFARDEMEGAAQTSGHRVIVQNLRFAVTQRRNAVLRTAVSTGGPATLKKLTTLQLIENTSKERGDRLRDLLMELGQRSGDDAINALGVNAGSYERDIQNTARTALVTSLTRLKPDELKKKLEDEKAEIRLAAVKVIRNRDYRLGYELIGRLTDEDANVREWAQATLIKMARGTDYGPPKKATAEQREQAAERWRNWWRNQK
jgi:hypothetical protein